MKKQIAQAAKGLVIASAVAGLMTSVVACGSTGTDTKNFKCVGGNSCAKEGQCQGEGHDCAGQSGCAGKGWIMTKDQAECDTAKTKAAEEAKKKK